MLGKFIVFDIRKGGKNIFLVVFYFWGKYLFLFDKLKDLIILVFSCDYDFEVKEEGERKVIV